MELPEEIIMPASSDECADDSDEDLVTDYLSGSPAGALGAINGPPGTGAPLVPTISVTPHSPGGKHCSVLDDTLLQLQEIRDSVQRMCGNVTQATNTHVILPTLGNLEASARLSASCPSLEQDSLLSSPELAWLQGSYKIGAGILKFPRDQDRRSSWTTLEDVTRNNAKHHRSTSLSSLESEPDSSLNDPLLGLATPRVNVRNASRARESRSTGGVSTHSLNEADLVSDCNKIIALREAQLLQDARLTPTRLSLQKSVSTPSIAPWIDGAPEPPPALPSGIRVAPVGRIGTESETEEELPPELHHAPAPVDLHLLLAQSYDQHAEKRRKRGSIFFRKKKDKDKDKEKTERVAHIWGPTLSHGSCDWCSKTLMGKPHVTCEICGITVHYSSCKDHLSDCKGKMAKGSKSATIGVPSQGTKAGSSKRGSFTHTPPSSKKVTGCYSPWRRVATKLGVNSSGAHDDVTSHHDAANFNDETPLMRFEFLEEAPIGPRDLSTDLSLGLVADEPDSWTPTTSKEVIKQLKDKQVKRQEHIYEFILTEKHHCVTLTVMQKVFVEGLQRHFQLGQNLNRMFPRLQDLIDLHLGFLRKLRAKQREGPVVDSLADILVETFSGQTAQKLKEAYGEFCSQHRQSLELYKFYMSNDPKFAEFIRHCQGNPLLKKKGVPECVLFVTQRLTKYPLLIEPLIKSSRDNPLEQEQLRQALAQVKIILVEVDARVAEREKEDRKLDIYHRIDAKSCTTHAGEKFKKSDILACARSLQFEGTAMLMQGRGKMQLVLVIVLSDCLFFLQESSHKYNFFTPDNKAGVVSLQKLLVREKAGGQDNRGIYLISSNPANPEMFELKVHQPKDKAIWIQAIRTAAQNCPQIEDDGHFMLSSEERHRLLEAKQAHIRQIVGALRQKDVEQALLLEEKMALQLKLLAAAGLQGVPDPPPYRQLVTDAADTGLIWREVLGAVQEVSQLASSLYAAGSSLSRSVSSAGEHQSDAYILPTLPKRAETFGGFDNPNLRGLSKKFPQKDCIEESYGARLSQKLPLDRLPWRNVVLSTVPAGVLNHSDNTESAVEGSDNPDAECPPLLSLGREQQLAAVQLSHYVYTLLCIISQQMTSINSLQAQISAYQGSGMPSTGTKHKHNDQLEELRNLQDKLTIEKDAWNRERHSQEMELQQSKADLLALQEQIKAEEEDIRQQREQLYRKMEVLSNQGLLLSPSVAIPATSMTGTHEESDVGSVGHHDSGDSDNSYHNASGDAKRKDHKWKTPVKPSLPLNLISATNQPKVQQSIKQQIPLKLSRLGNNTSSTSPTIPSSGATTVQQVLPMKLSQGLANPQSVPAVTDVRRVSAGYQRLSSGSFSPPSGGENVSILGGHSRTGSSPAMMQATPTNQQQQGGGNMGYIPRPGQRPDRTNTYPKIPDKFRVRNSEETIPTEEEVMFF